MDLGLEGRVALVTGASAGIGRGIAKVLAAEGMQVAAVARRRALLESLSEEIVQAGGLRPMLVVADLTEVEAAQRIHREVIGALGRVEVLINAAGTSTSTFRGSLANPDEWGDFIVDEQAWRDSFAINFDYIRRLSDACLPGMIDQGWGRIILVGALPEPHRMSVGLPAKVAGRAWMKGLSREVARFGVTINSVPVGRIVSEQILEKAYPTEQSLHEVAKTIPMGRLGDATDVANAVAFLSSAASSYITGQGLTVDGGMSMFAFY